jgi:hypothetical protein
MRRGKHGRRRRRGSRRGAQFQRRSPACPSTCTGPGLAIPAGLLREPPRPFQRPGHLRAGEPGPGLTFTGGSPGGPVVPGVPLARRAPRRRAAVRTGRPRWSPRAGSACRWASSSSQDAGFAAKWRRYQPLLPRNGPSSYGRRVPGGGQPPQCELASFCAVVASCWASPLIVFPWPCAQEIALAALVSAWFPIGAQALTSASPGRRTAATHRG